MSETGAIRGFKVFNHDWTCRDKQYTCPGVFEEDVTPSVCNLGMHFCKRASDCFNYYSFNSEMERHPEWYDRKSTSSGFVIYWGLKLKEVM